MNLEILTIMLWCAAVVFGLAFVIVAVLGDIFYELRSLILTIVFLVLCLVSIFVASVYQIKLNVAEAKAVISSFEDVKNQKKELGDNFVIEPSILKKYNEAKVTIEKYKNMGVNVDE